MTPVAHEHQGTDIGLLLAVGPQDFAAGLLDLGLGEGNVYLHDMGGIKQAPDVFRQTEDGGAAVGAEISPDAFEDPQPVMQGVGEQGNLGFVPGNEFAVEPDVLGLFHHGSFLR